MPPVLPAGHLCTRVQPVLAVDEIVLRPWEVGDAAAVVAAYADPDLAPEGTERSALLHTDGWHDMHIHARLRRDEEGVPCPT